MKAFLRFSIFNNTSLFFFIYYPGRKTDSDSARMVWTWPESLRRQQENQSLSLLQSHGPLQLSDISLSASNCVCPCVRAGACVFVCANTVLRDLPCKRWILDVWMEFYSSEKHLAVLLYVLHFLKLNLGVSPLCCLMIVYKSNRRANTPNKAIQPIQNVNPNI